MSITCPRCAHANDDGSSYCLKCGNQLSTTIQAGRTSSPSSSPAQMGTGQGQGSLRRAFAGYGLPVMHFSWLLPGQQIHAAAVRSTISQTLEQQGMYKLYINSNRLMERGLLTEEREYLIVNRGVSTVFI